MSLIQGAMGAGKAALNFAKSTAKASPRVAKNIFLDGLNPAEYAGQGLGKKLELGAYGVGSATLGGAIISGLMPDKHSKMERLWGKEEQERQAYIQYKAQETRMRRLQRDMAENAARLAAVAPDVYNRVMAGRMLPKGAAVFGGNPRTDLLEQLTLAMSKGEYQAPEEDPLAELM